MKLTRNHWLSWLVSTSLLVAQPLLAQNDDTATQTDQEKKTSAEMKAEAPDQAQAEDTNQNTSASSDATAISEENQNEGPSWGPPLISIRRDVVLKAGQTAETVVVIGGSAKIHGKVREAVVVIGGDLEIDGRVGDAAVAVFGNINAKPGANIKGEVVAVGGSVEVADGAKLARPPNNVLLPDLRWIGKYFSHCVLLLRPLAPEVGWVWIVAGIYFLFYLLVAALFPKPVEACLNELTRRPATTFGAGLLTKLLIPLILLILGLTGVGLFVAPFLLAALFLCAVVGKVALFQWLGLKLGRHFGEGMQKPLVSLLLGGLIIAILYIIPVVGLFTLLAVSVWGLGCAITAVMGGFRKEMPERREPVARPAPAYTPGPVAATSGFAPLGVGFAGSPSGSAQAIAEPPPSAAPLSQDPPVMPEALSYPRANFWERMGAGFLDLVLVGILSAVVGGFPLGLIVALAYFSGMWAWKGTTVGGIVLGLKVVRLDGQPLTFVVALVRGLAAGFSIFVLFLGFLWIAWDSEKQGWHDRIAGTVVLRLPRGTPLVCL